MTEPRSPDAIASFVRDVPQIVPEEWCLNCRICCRFPDTQGVQTPSWSSLEAGWAAQAGGSSGWFQRERGSPSLSPRLKPCGAGHCCPAFDASSNRCMIHPVRPLDCRLYPFVLAQSPGGSEVVLAMDVKCPFLQEHGADPEVARYASGLASYLDLPVAEEYVRQNPRIVGPFWPEFVSVAALPRLTRTVQGPARPPHPSLQPVTFADLPRLREALSARRHSCSLYTAAALLGWCDAIQVWQTRIGTALCLFAEQAGGLFMPLAPLVGRSDAALLQEAWRILEEANQGAGVSRIEGIEPEEARLFRESGFILREQEREYLYRREDLAGLRGDRYRSQRWSANRFRRAGGWRFRPFEERDRVPCLQLHTRWAIERQRRAPEPHARPLVRDGLFFHRRLMMSGPELGVVGRVLERGGVICGYTFGAPVSEETFAVLLEIADRSAPGAAQVLFQEFCREMEGHRWINAMGDSGLEGLRRAKLGYRPAGFATAWSATRTISGSAGSPE